MGKKFGPCNVAFEIFPGMVGFPNTVEGSEGIAQFGEAIRTAQSVVASKNFQVHLGEDNRVTPGKLKGAPVKIFRIDISGNQDFFYALHLSRETRALDDREWGKTQKLFNLGFVARAKGITDPGWEVFIIYDPKKKSLTPAFVSG
ncbi:MAG: hypothetical protein KBC33_03545 [Candidatus Pacebacteria bacterium]|nr:hypothetical protein [Candidatus Paceibacterota bacterium]